MKTSSAGDGSGLTSTRFTRLLRRNQVYFRLLLGSPHPGVSKQCGDLNREYVRVHGTSSIKHYPIFWEQITEGGTAPKSFDCPGLGTINTQGRHMSACSGITRRESTTLEQFGEPLVVVYQSTLCRPKTAQVANHTLNPCPPELGCYFVCSPQALLKVNEALACGKSNAFLQKLVGAKMLSTRLYPRPPGISGQMSVLEKGD
jgi:hypothetical protein